MKLSVITTTFNSSKHIKEFIRRISNTLGVNDHDYELIIVDDGSTDETIKIIRDCMKSQGSITLVELSRNFGHHQAIKCGFEYAKGKLIFLIDSDLEEAPELYHHFMDELKKNKLDIVYGVQKSRRGDLFEKLTGNIYYSICKFCVDVQMPRNISTIRLMKREFLDAFLTFNENQFILNGTTFLAGFKRKGIFIEKKRLRKSTYTIFNKFSLIVRSVTNYSSKPLYLLFCIGLLISTVSFGTAIYFLLIGLIKGISVPGWLSLICLSWLGVGITILSNGIIAIYLRTIFSEVKNRPNFLIRNIYKNKS